MKTRQLLPLFAGVVLCAGFSSLLAAAPVAKAPDNVTVVYVEPDKFTDVLENGTNIVSTYYLDQLRDTLLQAAAPLVPAGQKLTITVTDIDLAGETRFNQPHQIRIMKDIYVPRVFLKFQVVDTDGKVVKEGERRLINMDYLNDMRGFNSSEPLYHDKKLLTEWVGKEFKAKA